MNAGAHFPSPAKTRGFATCPSRAAGLRPSPFRPAITACLRSGDFTPAFVAQQSATVNVGGQSGEAKNGRKKFFFEKKNQKTFLLL
jgi:hypothetical protein